MLVRKIIGGLLVGAFFGGAVFIKVLQVENSFVPTANDFFSGRAARAVATETAVVQDDRRRLEECSRHDAKVDAFGVAVNAVRENLRAPSTAVFPWAFEKGVSISNPEPCKFVVSGFVDAQNGFGATLRYDWIETVTWDHKDASGDRYLISDPIIVSR